MASLHVRVVVAVVQSRMSVCNQHGQLLYSQPDKYLIKEAFEAADMVVAEYERRAKEEAEKSAPF